MPWLEAVLDLLKVSKVSKKNFMTISLHESENDSEKKKLLKRLRLQGYKIFQIVVRSRGGGGRGRKFYLGDFFTR